MLPKITELEKIDSFIAQYIPGGDFSTLDMRAVKPYLQALGAGDVYLEIGVKYGKSLTVAAILAPEAEIYGVDIVDLKGRQEYFNEIGLVEERVHFIYGNSVRVARGFNKQINVLFIDGNHSYESVCCDIEAWSGKVVSGGWLLFHDHDDTSPGVIKAVNDLLKNNNHYHNFFCVRDQYMSSMAGIQKK